MTDIEQPPQPSPRSSETPRSSVEKSVTTTTTNESCMIQVIIIDDDGNNIDKGSGRRLSCCSSGSGSSEGSVVVVDVDVKNVGGGEKVGVVKVEVGEVEERDCRICHLSLVSESNGLPIELGCSCKHDLAAAHRHCAEAWFKIRGNKTCEICGSTAKNVVGVNEVELVEQWNEGNDTTSITSAPPHPSETRHFWQGHRFLNFLLACMVFAFVISWLFHFNVPS